MIGPTVLASAHSPNSTAAAAAAVIASASSAQPVGARPPGRGRGATVRAASTSPDSRRVGTVTTSGCGAGTAGCTGRRTRRGSSGRAAVEVRSAASTARSCSGMAWSSVSSSSRVTSVPYTSASTVSTYGEGRRPPRGQRSNSPIRVPTIGAVRVPGASRAATSVNRAATSSWLQLFA